MADKKAAIVYIEKGRFFYYGVHNPNILKFDFPPTIVKDMEVLNKELLSTHVQSFISVNKLTPSKVTIFLSNEILFMKDVPGIEYSQKEEHIKAFIENVPFEKVVHVIQYKDKLLKIVTANQELCSEIKKAFEKLNFEIHAVVPSIFVENLTIAAGAGLDSQTASLLLAVADSLRQFNMMPPNPSQNPLQNITANAASKEHPKRLPLLLGVFGSLIAILIGVAVVVNRTPTRTPLQARTQPTSVIPTAVSSPIASPSATFSTYKVWLTTSSKTTATASQIQKALSEAGFSNFETRTEEGTVHEETQVKFAQTVPVSVQEQFMNELQKTVKNLTSQVVSGLETDILVTVGAAQ